jgi:hypothetical protein
VELSKLILVDSFEKMVDHRVDQWERGSGLLNLAMDKQYLCIYCQEGSVLTLVDHVLGIEVWTMEEMFKMTQSCLEFNYVTRYCTCLVDVHFYDNTNCRLINSFATEGRIWGKGHQVMERSFLWISDDPSEGMVERDLVPEGVQ